MASTATIQIQYVNQPKGSGPGSVKDSTGRYWQVWPDKLELFYGQEGQTFLVTYQTSSYRGKRQDTIIAALPSHEAPDAMPQAPRALTRAPAPRGAPSRAPMPDAEKQIDISVLSLMSSTEWAKKLPPGDMAGLSHILRVLRRAWIDHKAPTPNPVQPVRRPPIPVPQVPLDEEMNDSIPFFDERDEQQQEPMDE